MSEVEVQDSQPDQGESLLAQQVLVGEKTLDSCQRISLFRTCCKFGGKLYEMIVDGGSNDNLITKEIVLKLGLKRVRHPCPNRIGWLQDEHALKVR